MKKKLSISGLILLIVCLIAYFAVGNYFYTYALDAHDEKEFMEDNPNLADSPEINPTVEKASLEQDHQFLLKNPSKSLKIISNDNLQLHLQAKYFEQQTNHHKWVVVLHGYTRSSDNMTRWIRAFYDKGYQIVAPDLRGHGKSEGDYIGMGWHDRLDTVQWIHEILQMDAKAEIVIFGVSMGGATAMMTSGEKLPKNVKVIVEDCGYASVSKLFAYQLDDLFGLPEFPVLNAANTVTNIRAGFDLYEASAVEQVKKSTTPMLFIHGDADTFVPYRMLNEVYEAAPVEKEKLVIPKAGHTDAVKVDPEKYWKTVFTFVDRYIETP